MPPDTSGIAGYDPRAIRGRTNVSVVAQHASEAAFLWRQRTSSTRAHNVGLRDLARLDGRLEGHLRGLALAGEAGWACCESQLDDGPAELFPATVTALRDPRQRHVSAAIDALIAEPKGAPAFVSALGWSSLEQAEL